MGNEQGGEMICDVAISCWDQRLPLLRGRASGYDIVGSVSKQLLEVKVSRWSEFLAVTVFLAYGIRFTPDGRSRSVVPVFEEDIKLL